MNPSQLTRQQRKRYIIIACVIVFVLAVLLLLPIISGDQADNTNSNQDQNADQAQNEQSSTKTLTINNFNEVVKGLPTSRRDLIEELLYVNVRQNLPDGDPASVTDATIRDGSLSQTFSDQTQILSTEFIVDISSIKQSYRVTDMFSIRPPQVTGLFDHTTRVTCLSTDELIYPSFQCVDSTSAGEVE